jgi:hypothetical protein
MDSSCAIDGFHHLPRLSIEAVTPLSAIEPIDDATVFSVGRGVKDD